MGIREMIRARTTAGVRRASRELLNEIQTQHRHFSSLRRTRRLSTASDLKLNFGCGSYIKPGWINIDTCAREADFQLDLREKLPFQDESASIVYSEHFFEHLEYPEPATTFLRESWRVLMAGGILSMGVPDTEWPIISYANGDPEYFRLARERFHPAWCDTRMHNLNFHFRQGSEHKYAYDFETLSKILEEVGFVSVERRAFERNLDSDNHMVSFLPRGTASLYVKAAKPISRSK
jgi:predicted SAM-dependent methyltransferase